MNTLTSLFGTVAFENEGYWVKATSGGWSARPILGFKGSTSVFPPDGLRLPLGQVEICFDEPIGSAYAVLVTAQHNDGMPFAAANWGRATENGFVVHLTETAADRTLVNAGFSFLVLPQPGA